LPNLKVLHTFYPNTKFIFAGDIFQSIQKEPRESILWYFMKGEEKHETLNTIKHALKRYYPEFKDKIDNWKSSNIISNANL